MSSSNSNYDLVIIGSGTAGLSAAMYAGRYRMRTLVVGREFGGETARAGEICNYPGVPRADGFELMSAMKRQAEDAGAQFVDGMATTVREISPREYEVNVGSEKFTGKTILLALGTERRKLGLPNEKEFTGRGVHYCVTCDGPVYAGKTVAIVGGGDASVKGANILAALASKVYFIVRDSELHAEPLNQAELEKHADNVEMLWETEVKELVGDDKLRSLALSRPHQGSASLAVDGLFIEIGAIPHAELARSLGIAQDDRGYLIVDQSMRTNVRGIFAAGDATNFFGPFKQCITAAAMGAVAGVSAYEESKRRA